MMEDSPTQNSTTPGKTATLSHLTMKGIGPAKSIELDFANRTNLLTGDNGLGKSFILEWSEVFELGQAPASY